MLSSEFVKELESIGKIENVLLSKVLVEVLKSGNINFKNKDGNTALILASYFEYEEVVKLLLKNGADINIQNKAGETALIYASYFGKIKMVELLLENGANVNIQNNAGKNALDYAISCRHENIENILRKAIKIKKDVVLEQEEERKNRLEEYRRVIKRVFR